MLGTENFTLHDLPSGQVITSGEFAEFETAYSIFQQTQKHRDNVHAELMNATKPIIFVEGDYDIRYIHRAAHLLGYEDLLSSFVLKDGDGSGNLDKVWKYYNNPMSQTLLPNAVVLLYDCDVKKPNKTEDKISRYTVPLIEENPIKVGIENLFPSETIQRLESEEPQYIDFQAPSSRRERGVEVEIPESRSVNKSEKSNMCNWLCTHGERSDFTGFEPIFEMLQRFVSP
ncbi:hypothetical protein IQ266_24005 [filamentous cyanobacterium LEGE 11480]|uniref:Uncharacterized protein n=1 Tax=Romeriopsis navalis LEGE 11480 TaxID=2777977 RepID=A0A928Z4N5_9CYAN|nr:hypothetical protein [Romeriopsis navalis]MBE9032806.1 hypothetical protein [Romeriopsis navalis LEGE 11480]